MSIVRDRAKRQLKLHQATMAASILSQFGMDDAKLNSTPMQPSVKLQIGRDSDSSQPLPANYPYAELVGSLLYLSCCTRPDISYAVGSLARYMAKPSIEHWQAAKALLRYLRGTQSLGLNFGRVASGCLQVFADADYAGCLDTRRSTTGYVFLISGTAVSWSSKLQHTVAVSTAEAEFMAAAAAVREALWFKLLADDLGWTLGCLTILGDNQAALHLLKNPAISHRAKHIDVLHLFARERVVRGEVQFKYCPTEYNVADILTKSLVKQLHIKHVQSLGLV
jgi:hypothetical protein